MAHTAHGQTDRIYTPAPCVICGVGAVHTLAGTPVHLGGCLEAYAQRGEPTPPPEPAPSPTPTPAGPPPAAAEQAAPGEGVASVVVDHDGVHWPTGAVTALPQPLAHAGDLAQHVVDLGLRWYTGTRREIAQVWVTSAACRQFGIPVLTDLPLDSEDRDVKLAETSAGLGWLDDATAAGWTLRPGQLAGWVTARHTDGAAVRIVLLPYLTPDSCAMAQADQPDADTLARRLHTYATQVGIPFRLSGAVTGIDLMQATKPRPGRGHDRRIAAVDRAVTAPPPAKAMFVEPDILWTRPLVGDEREHRYLHVYDRNAHYLSAAAAVLLGDDSDPVHYPDGVELDETRPGYWHITAPDWTDASQPDPADPTGTDRLPSLWVATPTLSWLHQTGHQPEVREAWLWPATASRYLDTWTKQLREARKTLLTAEQSTNDTVLRDVKAVYKGAVGKLAGNRDAERGVALYRPDWRHQIVAAAKANLRRLIDRTGERSGRWPVAINVDAVYYTSDDPDPKTAWPGLDRDLDPLTLGKLSPLYSAELTDQLRGMFEQRPHHRAIRALTDSDALIPAEQWATS